MMTLEQAKLHLIERVKLYQQKAKDGGGRFAPKDIERLKWRAWPMKGFSAAIELYFLRVVIEENGDVVVKSILDEVIKNSRFLWNEIPKDNGPSGFTITMPFSHK